MDLFSGCVELRKAGAPVTILRQDGQAKRIDAPSLPVGILNDAHFAKADAVLRDGDLVVLLSDGALAAGDDWLCETVEQWQGLSPQDLAEELVAEAVARRSDGHDDDVTVLVLRMTTPQPIPKDEDEEKAG